MFEKSPRFCNIQLTTFEIVGISHNYERGFFVKHPQLICIFLLLSFMVQMLMLWEVLDFNDNLLKASDNISLLMAYVMAFFKNGFFLINLTKYSKLFKKLMDLSIKCKYLYLINLIYILHHF